MALRQLRINQFRNILSASLCLSPQHNVIVGDNGSGKTSVLEALFLLGRGKSFRSSNLDSLITFRRLEFSVFGELEIGLGSSVKLGIGRTNGKTSIRINGESEHSLAIFTRHFPVQYIGPDSHRLLEQGPETRRKYLDWGVFHVEPSFYPAWRQYRQTLKQRNAALRNRRGIKEIQTWDELLVASAEMVHAARDRYITRLTPHFQTLISRLLSEKSIILDYIKGWQAQPYGDVLLAGLAQDREIGFTRHGPHRADVRISIEGTLAKDCVSRGQQKLLVMGLILSQVALLCDATQDAMTLLVDDISAELDLENTRNVVSVIEDLGTQVCFTTIARDGILSVLKQAPKMFHVKHGELQEMI